MTTYLQCSCSSIRARGEQVTSLPPSLTNFRSQFYPHLPVFLLTKDSFTTVNRMLINRVCECCYDLICTSCGSKFRLFVHGNKGYIQFPKKKMIDIENMAFTPDDFVIPLQLKNFVHYNDIIDEKDDFQEFINSGNDDDFDLMFSHSHDNLVGSFQASTLEFPVL
ncbi:hypothetical protein TRFO_43028 [Tritrichomonas foetus]|uniref:Uncharacterized protein n=1 Tax=Tritrichomonas foetus TaxID=1144522 RepID=A0A1J4KTJ5_9EUKA|nr:hypothetical protein TRFO_43028 [Tritrichomonas foetus]|eukprot:OHT14458.1 hypothetical protein TRFO_43028 [Tritrichomonas foetus]